MDLGVPRAAGSAVAASKPKLAGLEALRGVAALGVVLYHVARHLDKEFATPGLKLWFQAGHAGVDLFFVLSGFIILFIHRQDIGRPARVRHYWRRRVSRVAPLYWIALAATLLIGVLARRAGPGLWEVALNVALLPTANEPLLGVAWTLQYEVMFYAVFSVLILDRRCGVAVLAVWLALTAFRMVDGAAYWLPDAIAGIYGSEFFLGMLAAWLITTRPVARPRLLAIAGAAAFAAAGALESIGVLDGYGALARLAYGLPAAMLILGVVAAERAGQAHVPRWLGVLGGASYSVYLFQFLFIGLVWKAGQTMGLDRQLPVLAWFATLVAAALAGGLLVSVVVERRLQHLLRPARRYAQVSALAADTAD